MVKSNKYDLNQTSDWEKKMLGGPERGRIVVKGG